MNDTKDNIPLPSNGHMAQLAATNDDTQILGFRDAFATGSEYINPVRWNKLYPYQLVVCKLENGLYNTTAMKFTLPMTPQELTIQTPFAIVNTITADGVAEEHNGVKVKQIQFSGSLGSAPLRGSGDPYVVDPQGVDGFKRLIAGGTIKAFDDIVQGAKDLAYSTGPRITNNYIQPYSVDPKIEATYKTTGYYQHILLDEFLHSYAAMKLRPENKNMRLAFCIWKDDTVYLVTPVSYTMKRSSSSPGEYMYDLQLKAWKRVELSGALRAEFVVEPKNSGWTVNRALKKLHEARDVIYKGKQTVEAVRGDADRLMNIVRETVLAARDAAGVAKTILDMPASIKGDYKVLIEKQASNLKEDIKATGKAAEDWGKI